MYDKRAWLVKNKLNVEEMRKGIRKFAVVYAYIEPPKDVLHRSDKDDDALVERGKKCDQIRFKFSPFLRASQIDFFSNLLLQSSHSIPIISPDFKTKKLW